MNIPWQNNHVLVLYFVIIRTTSIQTLHILGCKYQITEELRAQFVNKTWFNHHELPHWTGSIWDVILKYMLRSKRISSRFNQLDIWNLGYSLSVTGEECFRLGASVRYLCVAGIFTCVLWNDKCFVYSAFEIMACHWIGGVPLSKLLRS